MRQAANRKNEGASQDQTQNKFGGFSNNAAHTSTGADSKTNPEDHQKNEMTSLANLPPPIGNTNKAHTNFDDPWGGDDWNFDDLDKKDEPAEPVDIKSREYKHQNLNKLSDAELAHQKKRMDKLYEQNFVRPGDPKFVYDKVVDFSKRRKDSKNSWDGDDQ